MWPLISDYQEAIQSPRTALADPELQQGAPICNRLGLPVPVTGGFASVYQISSGGRRWAVRCFLREFADQKRRYQAIDQHLRAITLPYKVGFEYQPTGIRIRGAWYPILKMEWVQGLLLNEYVESVLGQRDAMRKLADDWLALVRTLKARRIAHGDLQHGNVLVAGKQLRLIDYDGMFVPSLAGLGSHETGHPSYQHPRRGPNDYGPESDRFSALAIYVALLALACEPRLWQQFNNGDNLLFRREDFEDPARSALFRTLRQLSDREVVSQALLLQAASSGPLTTVPEIHVLAAPPASPPAMARAPAAASRLPDWVAAQLLTAPPSAPARAAPAASPRSDGSFAVSWQRPGPRPSSTMTQRWWASLQGGPVYEKGHSRSVNAIAFALNSSVLVSGSDDRSALLWSCESGRRLALLGPHDQKVASVAAVGSSLIATASWDQRIRIWSRWGRLKRIFQPAVGSRFYSIAGSPDGALVAGGLGQSQIRLWSVPSGAEMPCLRGHARKVLSLAFSPDGEWLVSGSSDMTLRVWDVRQGRCRHVLSGHTDAVNAVAVSPDGQLIASGGDDGVIMIWDTRTGRQRLKIPAKAARVYALAFSPDGSLLFSGTSEPVIRFWDVPCGQEVGRLEGHTGAVRGLAVSADGKKIASCGTDGLVVLWSRPRESWWMLKASL
jgi:WD domain, G-beta repeat